MTAALADAEPLPPGNNLCWLAPNWLNQELSFNRCCFDFEGEDDCFRQLGGWYTREFCCWAPLDDDKCDWAAIEERVAPETWPESIRPYVSSPMGLREYCCVFPGDMGEHQVCWPTDEAGSAWDLPPHFLECCFPVLRRHLHADARRGVGSSAPAFLGAEVHRELAALEGRRWCGADLDAFEERLRPTDGSMPCRLRVRGGDSVELCDLSRSCELDPSLGLNWDKNDCSYVRAVHLALRIVGGLRPLPDMDLFISPSETDHEELQVPVFTRFRPREPRGRYVLLPQEWQLHPWQMRKQTTALSRQSLQAPWADRKPLLFWRGTNSNCFPGPGCSLVRATWSEEPLGACLRGQDCNVTWSLDNWLDMPRGRLVLFTKLACSVDARFTGTSRSMDASLWDFLEYHGLTAPPVPAGDQVWYRFGISVDGTGNSDRIYWLMLTGCVVLVQESPSVSWVVGAAFDNSTALRPFEHYVPVRHDLSDLVARLEWLLAHDAEAQRIAEAGRRFAVRHLSYDSVLLYLDRAVRRYATENLGPL